MSDQKIYRGIMRSVERPCLIRFLQKLSEWFEKNMGKQPKGGKPDVPLEK